jgi:hypothetical protein
MLSAIAIIAERRIQQAMEEGELAVPESWRGRPLPLEDESHIAADLRMACKVLRNAGYLPPEIETKKEIRHLEELIAASEDEHTRLRQMKKLKVLTLRLATMRQRPLHIEDSEYQRRVVERVTVAAQR